MFADLMLSSLNHSLSFSAFLQSFIYVFHLRLPSVLHSCMCSSVLLTLQVFVRTTHLIILFDIFCLIIYPFILSSNNTVNLIVHYFYMSPDIYYLTYILLLICPSPHRRMISPLCSTFQYYPTTNIIYLAASICMQKISLQILVYFVSDGVFSPISPPPFDPSRRWDRVRAVGQSECEAAGCRLRMLLCVAITILGVYVAFTF